MSRLPLISIVHNQSIETGSLASVPSDYLRGIETSYQLEMISATREELLQYFVNTLINGTRLTAKSLSGYSGGFGGSGDGYLSESIVPNALLTFVTQLMSGLRPLMERGNSLTVYSSPAEVTSGLQSTVIESCERYTINVQRRQASIFAYAEKVEKLYDPNAVSLRRDATKALIQGMSTTGAERDEHLDAAMRILRGCIENQGGMQDGSAWFQVGWILWKAGNLAEAEEAFFRSRRLSTVNKDAYLVSSCLHVAYMQYLQGRYEDAYTSAENALEVRKDYETLFDAARYAARTGRLDDAMGLLERCIHERPTTVITMFSEEDFCGSDNHTSLIPDMAALAAKVTGEARNRANLMVAHWRQAVEAVRRAELVAMRPIEIPKHLTSDMDKAVQLVSEADYLTALEWEQVALSYAEQTRRLAKEQMSRESTEYRQEVLKTRDKASDVLESTKSHVHASLQEQQLEIEKVSSLFHKRAHPSIPANLLLLAAGCACDYLFSGAAHDYLKTPSLHFTDKTLPLYIYYTYLGVSWLVFTYVLYIIAFFIDGSVYNSRVLAIQSRYTRQANSIADTTKDHHSDLKKQAYKAQEERRRADLALQQLDSE